MVPNGRGFTGITSHKALEGGVLLGTWSARGVGEVLKDKNIALGNLRHRSGKSCREQDTPGEKALMEWKT
jgi:hypothetical protein